MSPVVRLADRRQRAFAAPAPTAADTTLEAAQRQFLAQEDARLPWSSSVLISMLVGATPVERGAIIRELSGEGR